MSNIVAVDSSGKTAGVCVVRAGDVLMDKTLDKGLTHSETLLPLVQEALGETGLSPADVGLWAVTAGPGSFTGLRIGLALVKGLAFPQKSLVAPVSTLEALAAGSGLAGTVICALDARRGEVYWAAFSVGDGVHRLTEDAASPVEAMGELVRNSEKPLFFVGDGAEICYTIYDCETAVERPPLGHTVSIARGAAVLAAQLQGQNDICPAAAVQPRYLRLPQAERERNARLAGGETP